MPALYSHTTRATGTVLTATIYNGDHQNHIDNGVPGQLDDYSNTVGQMQTATNPGGIGSESLATSLAGELERVRYVLKQLRNGDQWYAQGSAPGAHSFIDRQIFTSSGTWTKPAGCTAARIFCIGGGGAGGGAAVTGASQGSVGGGGAAGAYCESFAVSGLGATETVTIGAGGTGVSGAAGNTGGTTSFGTHVIAPGGSGGFRDGASNGTFLGRGGSGVLTGAAGSIRTLGNHGAHGISINDGIQVSGGNGGASVFGGGNGLYSYINGAASAAGNAATANTGAGGGGAANGPNQGGSPQAGGAGGSGIVIVDSYT